MRWIIVNERNVTTQETAECLFILQEASGPMTAAELAGQLYLQGLRETQRRRVRALVKQLRDNGSMIVATLAGGYWLTKDHRLWTDYLEGRQIDAKRVLGQTYGRQKQARARRQEFLFDMRTPTGCATIGYA